MKNFFLSFFLLFFSCTSYAVVGPISGSTGLCAGSYTTLTDTTAGGTWSSSNATVAPVGSLSGSVTGLSTGTAIITYTTGAGYATTVIAVHPLPAVYSVTGGGSYCAGGSGVAVGVSSSGAGTNYFLHSGTIITGPVAGTGGPVSFGLQTASGVYTVVAVNTMSSCSANMADSAVVGISPVVAASVSISPGPGDSVCSGTTVVFTALPVNGGTAPSFRWQVNGIGLGADTSSYTYVPANGDVVTVRLVSNASCTIPDTAMAALTMFVLPRQWPSVVITAFPGDTVCTDYPVTLSADAAYGGSSPTFRWTVNGITAGFGTVYTYIPANGDVVNCELNSDYECLVTDSVKSDSIKIAALDPVIPSFTINAYPGYVVEVGSNDTLVASVSGGAPGLAYQWVINDSVVPGAVKDTFIYNNSNLLKRTDSVSCIISSNRFCRISTSNWTYITGIDLGVQTLSQGLFFSLFPNPNNGTFTIKGHGINGNTTELDITDMYGQTVFSRTILPGTGDINLPVALPGNMPGGIYTAHYVSDAGNRVFSFIIYK